MGLFGSSDPVKQQEKALASGTSHVYHSMALAVLATRPLPPEIYGTRKREGADFQEAKHEEKQVKQATKDVAHAEKSEAKAAKSEHKAHSVRRSKQPAVEVADAPNRHTRKPCRSRPSWRPSWRR